jgi:uncharacterized protein with HEPN domain
VRSKRPERHFRDILDNIERIERYTAGMSHETLYADDLRMDAVERCFQRLTEAAARLGEDGDALAPGIPWKDIRAFGNHLRHGYDRLDELAVWHAIVDDLPPLKAACLAAIAKLPDPDD